jgi:pimeloyl-ACP methyl ester carboxylesterase
VTLFGRAWMPSAPRAVIALVHGINEHSGRYGFLAERAGQRGLGVVSVDLRGHGRSPGVRAYVESFDDYLFDVDALLDKARELAAGRPVFLMGHSMGGAIALRWVAQRGPRVAGLALSSAALKIGGDVPRLLVWLAPFLSRWLPRMRGTRLNPEVISRDPAVVAARGAANVGHDWPPGSCWPWPRPWPPRARARTPSDSSACRGCRGSTAPPTARSSARPTPGETFPSRASSPTTAIASPSRGTTCRETWTWTPPSGSSRRLSGAEP